MFSATDRTGTTAETVDAIVAPNQDLIGRVPSSARPPGAGLAAVCVAAVALASVAFFFRYQIGNGFTYLTGDRYDQVIGIAIYEHWRNVFRGLAPWRETGYYFPASDTLGYNDGWFLNGAIYSLIRAAGADPFLSGELVNVALRLVAFLGCYAMARRVLALGRAWALLASVLFTLSNNMFVQAAHAQLLTVGLVPVMVCVLNTMLAAVLERRRGAVLAWGATAACLFSAWLLTAFYMAWYVVFFGTFLAAALAALAGREGCRRWWRASLDCWVPLVGVVLVLAITSAPFFAVYLPKARETGMHPYSVVSVYEPTPPDIVHVGSGNLLYGSLDTALNHVLRPGLPPWTEGMTGFPPALLILFACGALSLLRAKRPDEGTRDRLLRASAAAVLVTWAFTFRIHGLSLWWFVYTLFPGAKAARVVARYQIFLALPIISIAICYLAQTARRLTTPLLVLLCALLVLEEINTLPLVKLDRPHELARLAAAPPAPAGCWSFYLSRSRGEPSYLGPALDGIYSANVDAMLIAQLIHLPTINGTSTFMPPDFDLFNADRPDYRQRVEQYATRYHLAHLCALDPRTMRWSGGAARTAAVRPDKR